jgi:hypothetical protein
MTMLASHPRIPPTTIQIMNNMLSPPQGWKKHTPGQLIAEAMGKV